MSLVSFNGPFVNGIPTYPYAIQYSATFPLIGMCDDYYHDGAPGDRWKAYLNNVEAPNLAYMRFGNQGIVPYEEASWLLIQTYLQPSTQWPDMNYAVWHIFNPTVPITSNAQNWINLAAANYPNVDYSQIWVATPVQINAPPTGDQEFLFLWPYTNPPIPPEVPEPGTLALFGTSTVAAAVALRRKWMR